MRSFLCQSIFLLGAALFFGAFGADFAHAQKPKKTLLRTTGSEASAQKLLDESQTMIATEDPASLRAAIPKLQKAAQLFSAFGNKPRTAACYNFLGNAYDSLNDLQAAISYYRKSLALFERLDDPDGTSLVLNNLGWTWLRAGDAGQSLENYARGLEIAEKSDDTGRQSLISYNTAFTYAHFGEKKQATEYYLRALNLATKNQDAAFEYQILGSLGMFYLDGGNRREALKYLTRALELPAEISTDEEKFALFNNTGQALDGLGEKQRALDFYTRALNLLAGNDNPLYRATVINNIALTHLSLGDTGQALDKFRQALALTEKNEDNFLRARILNNIGKAEDAAGNQDAAVDHYNESVELSKQAKDFKGALATLNNLIVVLLYMNEAEDARKLLVQALPYFALTGDRELEATVLNNFARTEELTGNPAEGAKYYAQALAISREGGYKPLEAQALSNLMFFWEARKNPSLAVFFGKQAVNVYQEIRTDIKNFDESAQGKYLKSIGATYRKLADIFINLGRLPEAESILAMLKEEEYLDFIQRDGAGAKKMLTDIQLTDEETKAVARYEEIADRLTQKGLEFDNLKRQIAKSPEEKIDIDKKRAALGADLEAAAIAFNLMLRQIEKEFSASTVKTNVEVSTAIGGADDLQSKLRRSKLTDTAIVSTIVTDDNLYLILTTPTVKIVEKSPVKAAELNKLVQDFRKTLQNPGIDPRPSGQKLYELLFRPLEAHLAPLEAQNAGKPLTLVWSLDGALRYVPVSALWNGRQYLVEKYQNVVFTLASRSEFDQASAGGSWRGLGLGVSQAWGDFEALPSVTDELLQGAIRADNVAGSKGIVAGKVLLDREFTARSFADSLASGEFSMIHIASHFSLQPGGYAKSFLLLGTGEFLSLDKIQKSPEFVFDNVELLTLSACNTAIGGTDASGREIEGFAKLAQDKGARAVMATLWSVADDSTREFMSEFYRERQEKQLSKAASMRLAQLSLLNGAFKTDRVKQSRRSDLAGQTDGETVNHPPFEFDPNKPYGHPYFWSPFVLIGNWR